MIILLLPSHGKIRRIARPIRKTTGVRDIIEDINKSTWIWAGHIINIKDNRWTTRWTKSTPRTHTQIHDDRRQDVMIPNTMRNTRPRQKSMASVEKDIRPTTEYGH